MDALRSPSLFFNNQHAGCKMPPKYRENKLWQQWKLTKLEAKMQEYTRAALAGGK
jgi:hypothetical protein